MMENMITINSLNYTIQVLPEPTITTGIIKKKEIILKENQDFLRKTIRDDKEFKCKKCDKSYDTQKALKRHLCMLKFVCTICPEKVGFGFLQHYNGHMQTVHQGFKCDVCDKNFQWPGYLRSHQNMVHKQQSFQCPNCKMSFAHTRYLRKHMSSAHGIVTNGYNGYKCDLCNKLFSEKGYLNSHLKTVHEGGGGSKNDNRCELCTKQFKTKYDMRRHLKNVHKVIIQD